MSFLFVELFINYWGTDYRTYVYVNERLIKNIKLQNNKISTFNNDSTFINIKQVLQSIQSSIFAF